MFTGLIEATGRVERIEASEDGRVVQVATRLAGELRSGDSISVSGVCLTVTESATTGFRASISPATLRVTTLLTMTEGRLVNLERPLRADGRLGGHFVLGHVDAVGRVASLTKDGDCYWLDVETPASLAPYFIPKGSIAIDGISLTVANITATGIGVQIIPFTFEHTALAETRQGDAVNLEADVIGKYVVRLLGDRIDVADLAAGRTKDRS